MLENNNLHKFLDEIILEVEKELDEETTSGDIAGYDTPNAFGAGRDKDKKKTKDTATQAGYTVVNESISKSDVKIEKSNTNFWNVLVWKNQWISFSKHRFEGSAKEVMKAITSGKGMKYVEKLINKQNQSSASEIIAKSFEKNGIARLIGEAKKPKKRTNRWLELKNDDTMHGHKKLAVGLKELKYQLREVEKFLGWYGKLKNINELESDNYWKRTNTNIKNIKERIINIARKLQEIEK